MKMCNLNYFSLFGSIFKIQHLSFIALRVYANAAPLV